MEEYIIGWEHTKQKQKYKKEIKFLRNAGFSVRLTKYSSNKRHRYAVYAI